MKAKILPRWICLFRAVFNHTISNEIMHCNYKRTEQL